PLYPLRPAGTGVRNHPIDAENLGGGGISAGGELAPGYVHVTGVDGAVQRRRAVRFRRPGQRTGQQQRQPFHQYPAVKRLLTYLGFSISSRIATAKSSIETELLPC